MRDDKRSFVVLDGLRGIAAFTVVLGHVSYTSHEIVPESYLAVDFFFVLSGFVLAHAYGEKLREGLPAMQFMLIRLVRLYPLYLLAIALWLPLGWLGLTSGRLDLGTTAFTVVTAVFFLPRPLPGLLYPLNPAAWSLFFELTANAELGALGRLLGNFTLCFIVGSSAVALAVYAENYGIDGGIWAVFWSSFFRVSYSFFAGILIYRIWLARKPFVSLPALIVLLGLLGILICRPVDRYESTYALLAALLAFPLLIWIGASSKPGPFIARICSWLGAVSYAVYVLHLPLYFLTIEIANVSLVAWPWQIAFLGLVIVVADLADRYFDGPVRKRLSIAAGV